MTNKNKIKKSQNQKGFTLIELLVVISIIGVLSSVVMVSLNSAKGRARDAVRLSDINQIQKALDVYYDEHGAYPISGNCGSSIPNGGWCNSVQGLSGGHWVRNGSSSNLSDFFNKDPIDPKDSGTASWTPYNGGTYFYFASGYGGSGQWYMIIFGLEDHNNSIQQQDGVTACNGTYFHYGNGSNGIVTVGGDCKL